MRNGADNQVENLKILIVEDDEAYPIKPTY